MGSMGSMGSTGSMGFLVKKEEFLLIGTILRDTCYVLDMPNALKRMTGALLLRGGTL